MATGEAQTTSQDFVSDWFHKTAELTEATLRATAQMQLAGLDQFMGTMLGAKPPEEVRKAPEQILKSMPVIQRAARDYMQSVERVQREGMRIMQEFLKSSGKSKSSTEMQKRVRKEWKGLLDGLSTSAQALVQANTRAMEELARSMAQRLE